MKCQKVEVLGVLPNNCSIEISKMVPKALIRSCWTADRQKNKEILPLKATRKWQRNQAQKIGDWILMINHVLI